MTAWWNNLSNYEQVVILSTSIPVLFVVIVSVLAVAHGRKGKCEEARRLAAVEEERRTSLRIVVEELPEPGTLTPEERSEEYRQIDPDPSRPYMWKAGDMP